MAEMDIEWANLDENEKVLWQGRPRMKSIIPVVLISIPFVFVGIGVFMILAAYLNVMNTSFVVTNQGLYKKTGIMSRNVQKIGFDKVQNISFSQGIFGNYFDFGSIEISTAGGQGVEMKFNSINDPRKVEDVINQRLDHSSGQSQSGSQGQTQQVSNDQVVKELREIKQVLKDMNSKMG